MAIKVKVKGNKIKVIAGSDYAKPGNVLLKITDTENGLICKFPAWRDIEQDYYVCLDYAEASYLKKALQHVKSLEGDEDD